MINRLLFVDPTKRHFLPMDKAYFAIFIIEIILLKIFPKPVPNLHFQWMKKQFERLQHYMSEEQFQNWPSEVA